MKPARILPLTVLIGATFFSCITPGMAKNPVSTPLWTYGEQELGSTFSIDKHGRLYITEKKDGKTGIGVYETGHQEAKWFLPVILPEQERVGQIPMAPLIDNRNGRVWVVGETTSYRGFAVAYDISGGGEPVLAGSKLFNERMQTAVLPENGNLVIVTGCAIPGNTQTLYQLEADTSGLSVRDNRVTGATGSNCRVEKLFMRSSIPAKESIFIPHLFSVDKQQNLLPAFWYNPVTHKTSPWSGWSSDNKHVKPEAVDQQGNKYYPGRGCDDCEHIDIWRETPAGERKVIWQVPEPNHSAFFSVESLFLSENQLFVITFLQGKATTPDVTVQAVDIRDTDPVRSPLWITTLPNPVDAHDRITESHKTASAPALSQNGTLYVANAYGLAAIDTHNQGALSGYYTLPPDIKASTDLLPDQNGRVWLTGCRYDYTKVYRDRCRVMVFEGDGSPLMPGSSFLRGDLANTGRLYAQDNGSSSETLSPVQEIRSADYAVNDHGAQRFSWQVSDKQGKLVESGHLDIDGADPMLLDPFRWPMLVSEAINRQGGMLKAGPKNGTEEAGPATPIASQYRNWLWLPEDKVREGYHVEPLLVEQTVATPSEWHLNTGSQQAFTSQEGGSFVGRTVIFTVTHNGKPESYPVTTRERNRFLAMQDIARQVNATIPDVRLGEKISGNTITPLTSQYRNKIWVKGDSNGHPVATVSWRVE